MSVRKNLTILNRTTAGVLLAAVGTGIWGWFHDADTSDLTTSIADSNDGKQQNPVSVNLNANPANVFSSKALIGSELWTRQLQAGSLKDRNSVASINTIPPVVAPVVPPPVAMPPAKQTTDLGLRLVGTVIESDRSMAIAIDRQGKLDFRSEGDSLQLEPAGVRIEAVLADSVRISYQGENVQWAIGQTLRFEQEDMGAASVPAPTSIQDPSAVPAFAPISAPTAAPPAAPVSPPRTLEEELDLINGVPDSNPF